MLLGTPTLQASNVTRTHVQVVSFVLTQCHRPGALDSVPWPWHTIAWAIFRKMASSDPIAYRQLNSSILPICDLQAIFKISSKTSNTGISYGFISQISKPSSSPSLMKIIVGNLNIVTLDLARISFLPPSFWSIQRAFIQSLLSAGLLDVSSSTFQIDEVESTTVDNYPTRIVTLSTIAAASFRQSTSRFDCVAELAGRSLTT